MAAALKQLLDALLRCGTARYVGEVSQWPLGERGPRLRFFLFARVAGAARFDQNRERRQHSFGVSQRNDNWRRFAAKMWSGKRADTIRSRSDARRRPRRYKQAGSEQREDHEEQIVAGVPGREANHHQDENEYRATARHLERQIEPPYLQPRRTRQRRTTKISIRAALTSDKIAAIAASA